MDGKNEMCDTIVGTTIRKDFEITLSVMNDSQQCGIAA